MSVVCVDLSSYQKGFDFQEFKEAGGLGVILKATENNMKDSCYKSFKTAAQKAGLAVASYHFMRHSEPVTQAETFFNVVQPVAGERLVCDFEDNSVPANYVISFLETLKNKNMNLQLTVYGSPYFLIEKFGSKNAWVAQETSLWLAEYTKSSHPAPVPSVWPTWSLWQYSDREVVKGFGKGVDASRFNGSDDLFLKWMGNVSPSSNQTSLVS